MCFIFNLPLNTPSFFWWVSCSACLPRPASIICWWAGRGYKLSVHLFLKKLHPGLSFEFYSSRLSGKQDNIAYFCFIIVSKILLVPPEWTQKILDWFNKYLLLCAKNCLGIGDMDMNTLVRVPALMEFVILLGKTDDMQDNSRLQLMLQTTKNGNSVTERTGRWEKLPP